jgi:protocatechuate 3,4-dioxygenase beta subunit
MSELRLKYFERPPLSRRGFLRGTAVALIAAGAARSLTAAGCQVTTGVIEGPYWRPGAPLTSDIRLGREGAMLIVRGRVTDENCQPLAGAKFEVWQADGEGKYDLDYDRDGPAFLRGRFSSDAKGNYELTTIRPAPYGLGGGTRPAHIHFKISAPGHRSLTTQLYFADDPFLTRDPLRAVHNDLVAKPVARQGLSECRFDIRLKKA